jgi:hypothetical protein
VYIPESKTPVNIVAPATIDTLSDAHLVWLATGKDALAKAAKKELSRRKRQGRTVH